MRSLPYVFIMFFAFQLNAQNPSYKLFEDEIFPAAENEYQKAKTIYVIYKDKYNYDPSNISNFLDYSLKNKDIQFFKKEITNLIKNYGFSYSSEDTLLSKFESSFYEGIYENHLHLWLMKTSQKYYPKWLEKHPLAIEYERLLNIMITRNKDCFKFNRLLNSSSSYNDSVDSIQFKNLFLLIENTQKNIQIESIRDIAYSFFKNGKKMITNFDHYSFGNTVYFIVSNNLNNKTNLDETWSRLHSYFEQAYLDGYDAGRFFRTYDYYLNQYFGLQYYGTLGKYIPLKDQETFEERKERLHLELK